MKRALMCVCLLMASMAMLAQDKSPAVGTWKLDTAASQHPIWSSATWTITKDTDDAIAYRMTGTEMKGGKHFDNRFSGKKGEEVTEKDGTKLTWNKDGSFVVKGPDGGTAELKMEVSEDHNTLTVAGKNTEKDGKTEDIHDVWKRVGGAKKSAASSKMKTAS